MENMHFFLSPTKKGSVFVATNRRRRGRIEFFLEWPYLDNVPILLNVLLADASHPSGSNVFVGSDLSFCSPLSWCKGGVRHYLKSKPRGSSSCVLWVFSFHPQGSVPFLLAFPSREGPCLVQQSHGQLCPVNPRTGLSERFPSPCWQNFPPPPRSSSASINPVFGPSVPVSLHTGSSRSIAKLISLPQK